MKYERLLRPVPALIPAAETFMAASILHGSVPQQRPASYPFSKHPTAH